MIVDFCKEHAIPYELCGKVIAACSENELSVLEGIFQRGIQNGLEGIERLDAAAVKEKEPHCAAIKGIWVLHVRLPRTNRSQTIASETTIAARSKWGSDMEAIVGIFQSRTEAEEARLKLHLLGVDNDKIATLNPGITDRQVQSEIRTSDSEAPGMGAALGGTVGGAVGAATGASLAAAATGFALVDLMR